MTSSIYLIFFFKIKIKGSVHQPHAHGVQTVPTSHWTQSTDSFQQTGWKPVIPWSYVPCRHLPQQRLINRQIP